MAKTIYYIERDRIKSTLTAPEDFNPSYPMTDRPIPEGLQKDGVILGYSWNTETLGWYDASEEEAKSADAQRDSKIADLTEQLTDATSAVATLTGQLAQANAATTTLKKQVAMMTLAQAKADTTTTPVAATDTTATEPEEAK
ncbi:MAG: hypothetical protein LKG24_00935 [Lacticaseibacillus songhuajiangensis]|jgi:hypothetical protein|nr:hypothetical protein [Lacticaseibacillus songhuajiangensis]